MKKLLVVLAILLIALPIFAWQENYRQSSEQVQLFYALRRLSGTSTAEPTFPISGTQLLSLLESLDTSRFGSTAMSRYNDLKEELSNPVAVISYDNIGFDLSSKILPFQWWESDVDPLFYPYKDRPDLLNLEGRFNITEYFSGKIDLNITTSPGNSLPTSNIFSVFKDWDSESLYGHIPDIAYGSVGYKSLNFTVGRDRLSAGNSFTGNLELNENFNFTDYIKASFVRSKITYDMVFIDTQEKAYEQITLDNPRKQFANHRLSMSFFDHLSITLSEGAMVYIGNIFSSAVVFNPFMVIHDWYSFGSGNTNNYFSAEVQGNYKGFEASFQYFFDQINTRFEDNGNGKNASALLLNTSYTAEVKDGILTSYVEFVHTTPLCYLKETNPEYDSSYWYDESYGALNEITDLYVGITKIWGGDATDISSIGYPYGTAVTALGAGAKYLWHNQEFTTTLYWLSKGAMGAGVNEQRAADLSTYEGFDATTKMFRLNFGVKGTVHEKLIGYALKAGFNVTKNKDHINGNRASGFEFSFALNVDPTVFIPRHQI